MDQQKDINESGAFQGQNKNTQQPQHINNMSFLSRKSEKLTTALYMVTDIMSDKEPIKWSARETAVELFSDIALASSMSSSERMSILRSVMKKIEKVVSFLDIAQSARMMSQMNASVLKKEYVALKDALDAEWNHVYGESKKTTFHETFFDIPHEPRIALNEINSVQQGKNKGDEIKRVQVPITQVPRVSDPRGYQGQQQMLRPRVEQDKKFFSQRQNTASAQQRISASPVPVEQGHVLNVRSSSAAIKPSERAQGEQGVSQEETISQNSNNAEAFRRDVAIGRARTDGDRDERRKIILALLEQKPALTVRDIAKNIPAVSEKTIQRELLAMVAESLLIKTGERRWSVYSLRPME